MESESTNNPAVLVPVTTVLGPTRFPFLVESYDFQSENIWPRQGKHILAQNSDDVAECLGTPSSTKDASYVVVYQAYRPDIAEYATKNQHFQGCSQFNENRMTWIKTNFLWMMFRSGWASKTNQERILAIWLRRSAFEGYLEHARTKGPDPWPNGLVVRLQWDPDHRPSGRPIMEGRRAIQLGLKNVNTFVNGQDILQINDITPFVKSQNEMMLEAPSEIKAHLTVPRERIYVPDSEIAIDAIDLDNIVHRCSTTEK